MSATRFAAHKYYSRAVILGYGQSPSIASVHDSALRGLHTWWEGRARCMDCMGERKWCVLESTAPWLGRLYFEVWESREEYSLDTRNLPELCCSHATPITIRIEYTASYRTSRSSLSLFSFVQGVGYVCMIGYLLTAISSMTRIFFYGDRKHFEVPCNWGYGVTWTNGISMCGKLPLKPIKISEPRLNRRLLGGDLMTG